MQRFELLEYGVYRVHISDALIRLVNKTTQKLSICDEERPVAIQIYGRETDAMVGAAQIAKPACPDISDINFGCPVKRPGKEPDRACCKTYLKCWK